MSDIKDFRPDIDTNLGILIDYQIAAHEKTEILTTEDNLIIIAVTNHGLKCFAKYDGWIELRIAEGELAEIEPGLMIISDFKKFISELDPLSYMFRFTASSFSTMPPQLLTFSFDILRTNGSSYAASISKENHPIVALYKSLSDLNILLEDVSGLSVTIEYCGEIVFKSPKSLTKAVFKGKAS